MTCWQTAVRAIERHVVVHSVPLACAGLSQAQLNHIVASAVRAAAGPHPKAAQRRIAVADARYLGSLVRTAPLPQSAQSPAPPGGSLLRPSPAAPVRLVLAALGCWTATAAAGGYLFAGHRRTGVRPRRIPAIAASHAGVAVGGLAVWATFALAPRSDALAWTAGALLIGAAGLGLAVLLASPPDRAPAAASASAPVQTAPELASASAPVVTSAPVRASSPVVTSALGLASAPAPAAGPQRTAAGNPAPRRVLAIAGHAALAVVTILLVLLAATGSG